MVKKEVVTKVIDGDTFETNIRKKPVRLANVDTPEKRQPGYQQAKKALEEEILGRHKEVDISGPHKTMVKFLGSIIIALSIEALMLVFKFAITDPAKLMSATYIIGGVAVLILSLAVYIRFTKEKNSE